MKKIKAIAVSLVTVLVASSLCGCGLFETMSGILEDKPISFSDVNDLENGKAYV